MLTRDRAIAIAHATARQRGWPWFGHIEAWCSRKWFLFGPRYWNVVTNADCYGCNVWVMIDDVTGEVLFASFAPR